MHQLMRCTILVLVPALSVQMAAPTACEVVCLFGSSAGSAAASVTDSPGCHSAESAPNTQSVLLVPDGRECDHAPLGDSLRAERLPAKMNGSAATVAVEFVALLDEAQRATTVTALTHAPPGISFAAIVSLRL